MSHPEITKQKIALAILQYFPEDIHLGEMRDFIKEVTEKLLPVVVNGAPIEYEDKT